MEIVAADGKQARLVEAGFEEHGPMKAGRAVDGANRVITGFRAVPGSCSHNHSVDGLPACRCAPTDGSMKIH